MDNISFGQYVPGNSWIYKLDPRMKIFLTIALIVLIFLIPTIYGMLIALGVFLLIFLTTRISIIKVIRGIKGVLFLLLFTVILQLIYTKGDNTTILYTFNMSIGLWQTLIIIGLTFIYFFTKKYMPLKFTYLLLILFLVFLVLWNSPFKKFDWDFNLIWNDFDFVVYNEGDINNGLESILSPLKLLHIPVAVFAMLISLTLRFIPTLMQESRKIMNAQASRGVDFNEGSLKEKVNQIISLLVPMFVISFKRAEDLSNAMEARGYIIGAKRTKLDELKLRWRDYLCLLIVIALFGLVIWSMIYYA